MNEYFSNVFKEKFGNSIKILEILEENGYLAYFVGGCVRDFCLEKEFSDIDITTSATPEEVKSIFKITIDTGLKHGTVTIKFEDKYYEVTTFRSESNYVGHRYPEKVEYIKNVDDDLSRRDFTINAMALDKNGNIIDIHNGQVDLKNKVIKTVNNPDDRFNEDALRMLRAFRFSSQLDFKIEEKTLNAISNNVNLIKHISIERIVGEFKKLLSGIACKKSFNYILKTKLNLYIPVFDKVKIIRNYSKFTFEQSLFLIFFDNKIPIGEIKKLKISNKSQNKVKIYFDTYNKFKLLTIKELCYRSDINDLLFINEIFNFYENDLLINTKLPIKNSTDVYIDYNSILNLFPNKKPGSWLKEIFIKIEKEILLGNLNNNREEIEKYLLNEVDCNE